MDIQYRQISIILEKKYKESLFLLILYIICTKSFPNFGEDFYEKAMSCSISTTAIVQRTSDLPTTLCSELWGRG